MKQSEILQAEVIQIVHFKQKKKKKIQTTNRKSVPKASTWADQVKYSPSLSPTQITSEQILNVIQISTHDETRTKMTWAQPLLQIAFMGRFTGFVDLSSN